MHSLLFPAYQPKQVHRIKQIFLAFACYVFCTLVMGFSAWQGLFPAGPLAIYTMCFILGSTAFFVVTRLGWNLRFADPSMTVAQIAYSSLLNCYILIYAGPLRGVFMISYLAALMFGGTHLSPRQLMRLVALPAVLFPVVVFLAARFGTQTIDWHVEFVHWMAYWVIASFFSLLVDKMRRLQKRLKASKAELETAMSRLAEMAVRDELTGLYNRRHMMELLASEHRRAERSGDIYCVCLIDIDYFKRINDTYGHGDGDTVLRTFAAVSQQCLRGTDNLARWGGEEFLLLLPQSTHSTAEVVLERIMKGLEMTVFEGLPAELRVTISAGVAQYQRGSEIKDLIEQADQALYSAKRAGRNRIVNANRLDHMPV